MIDEDKPRWRVDMTCCTFDDGFIIRDTYEEAAEFREIYVGCIGHVRTGKITKTDLEFGNWPQTRGIKTATIPH